MKKLFAYFILMIFFAMYSCKKSPNSPNYNQIDSIIGIYVGDFHGTYTNYNSGGIGLVVTVDTAVLSDSFIIVKISSDSFHCTLANSFISSSSYYGGLTSAYDNSNRFAWPLYSPPSLGDSIIIKIFPTGDSLSYEYTDISHGGYNAHNYHEIFSGKKIH